MPDDILEIDAPAGDVKPAAPVDAKPVTPAPSEVKPVGDGKAAVVDPAKPDDKAVAKAPTDADASDDDDDGLGLADGDDGKAAPAAWPDDWREKMSGGDEKLLKELKRFASVETWAKSQRALRQKLSSGEYKRASLPENATDEEKAAWRKENGIPDSPEGYAIPQIKGHEWSDADKPIVSEFLKDLHAAGTPQPQAEAALKWYAKFQQDQAAARTELIRVAKDQRDDALRDEFKSEYRSRVNLINRAMKDPEVVDPEFGQAIMSAVDSNGVPLRFHPAVALHISKLAMQTYGSAGLISGEQGARMGSRIDEIKKIMNTDLDKYYADGLDKEYMELQEKMEGANRR
jgi:hypothetical protein